MTDQQYMQLAIELARQGQGRTAPNPPVGAVIVRQDQIVGEGFHPEAGEPHAEIFALQQAGERTRGANLYVTLEPCSHQGKTGPCADAVIRAGITHVFIGVQDPNPQVAGRGIEKLRQAGITVELGIEEERCQRLIAPFARHILSGFPFTIYKTAMTLDGKTATASGDSRWISGEQSRKLVHQLRDRVEAIMVGIGTVLSDDPLLNTRLPNTGGRDPLRIVIDSKLKMPVECAMLQQRSSAKTLIATIVNEPEKCAMLQQAGAEVMQFPAVAGRVSLPDVWRELGRRNVQSLLLEGGATLAGSALAAGLIDQLKVFLAPKLIGGSADFGIFAGQGCLKLSDALRLTDLRHEKVGDDILLTGDIGRCLPD